MPHDRPPTLPLQNTGTIRVHGLAAARGERTIFSDVELEVSSRETVAFLGANGAGKTTLLRCLAGLLRPTAGEIHIAGHIPYRNLAVRRLVGMVSHEPFVYATLTPRENLQLAAELCDVPHPRDRIALWLEQAGLGSRADRPTGELSCGWRQRLSLIRAVVHQPAILLLDEPTGGLDAAGHHWLSNTLRTLRNSGTTICFTTHDRSLADALADRQYEIDRHGLRLVIERSSHGTRQEAAAA